MYSIICRQELQKQIREAVGETVGLYDEDVTGGLEKAARINSSTLILDADAGDATVILAGVRRYKSSRPKTRIIVLAPGRKPGDRLMASLFANGVYDIIATGDGEAGIAGELRRVIESEPADYADALRWDISEEESGTRIKEKTVYLEKTIGTGKICVAGVRRGAGCTTAAVAVAHYLALRKKNVVFIELCERPMVHRIKELFHKRIAVYDLLSRSDADEYNPMAVIAKLESRPDYIVMDMGTLLEEPKRGFDVRPGVIQLGRGEHQCFGEALRADLALLTLGVAPWGIYDLAVYQARLKDRLRRWDVLAPAEHTEIIKAEIGSKRVHVLPFTPVPFRPPAEWGEILAPVLPKTSGRRLWGWRR